MPSKQHTPRKRFGQNFLHDPAIIARIVASVAPAAGDRLVEIGPGQGAITAPLVRAAGSLDAVELDRDLLAPLRERCAALGDLRVHNRDALTFDFCQLAAGQPLRVVGNLPYNISTPLLFHLIGQRHCLRDMHFMLQKEVVDRMAAAPGNRTYGRLSVMIQAYCRVDPLFGIGPGAFRPAPKVESAFVRLTPYPQPPHAIDDQGRFGKLVAQAFSQRRKTLRNTLRPLLGAEAIQGCGIDPTLRPEQLSVADFVRLSNALV